MQVFCCGRGRRAQDRRTPSTPVPQSPAQPHQYRSQIYDPNTDVPMIPLDATRAPSLMTTPRHEFTIDSSILDLEDSETEPDGANHKSSGTNAFGALKAKLGRRLSQRPGSARRMQHSAASSEDELARRAELRRLRQRRIREELETEEKSESQSKQQGCSQDGPRAPTGSNVEAPRDATGLPLPAAENKKANKLLFNHAHETEPLALPTFTGTGTTLPRSSSHPASNISSREPSVNMESVTMPRQRDSLNQMPAPHLKPVYLPSIRGSGSMASWRLSYSASQLAELIGLTEEESNIKLTTLPNTSMPDSTELDHPQKSLEPKLSNAQSDRADRSSVVSVTSSQASNIANSLDLHNPHVRTEAVSSDKGENNLENLPESSVNPNADRHSPLELWLRVSNTLQSMAHSSTRRNSDSVMDSRPTSLVADLSSASKTQQLQPQSLPPSHALGTTLAKIPGAFPGHEGSSRSSPSSTEEKRARVANSIGQDCVTEPDSQEPLRSVTESSSVVVTHRSSKGSVAEHWRERLERPLHNILDANDMADTDRSETSSYKTAPVQNLTPDVKMLGLKTYCHSSFDSTAASDTASLKKIGVELESVAQRFADTRTSRNQSRSASSRFREEFDNPKAKKPTKKPSLFARLLNKGGKETQSTLTRPNQGHDDHKNCSADAIQSSKLAIKGRNSNLVTEGQANSVDISEKPRILESATDVWQRAVKIEANRYQPAPHNPCGNRHARRNSNHKSPSGDSSGEAPGMYLHARETSSLYSRSMRDSRSGIQSPKSRPVTGSENAEDISGISGNTSNRILREWQHQIQSEELGSCRTPSFTTYIYAARKFNHIPASWAKWPSHTRAERTGAAGTKDLVEPKDFASTATTSDGHTKRSADNDVLVPQTNENQSIPTRPSLSNKFGHNIKSGFAKMVPLRDDSQHFEDDEKQPGEDSYLEYPELELLANHGGYKELEALEHQIDKIKYPSTSSSGSRSRYFGGASLKTPLSLKLAREVHATQNTDREKIPDLSISLRTTPSQTPNASGRRRSKSHAKPGTSQQYGTPLTHVSYEDCVPTHMLDENDSSKSEKTVKRSKSNTGNGIPGGSDMLGTWNGRVRSNSASAKRVRAPASDLERITVERGQMSGRKNSLAVDVK